MHLLNTRIHSFYYVHVHTYVQYQCHSLLINNIFTWKLKILFSETGSCYVAPGTHVVGQAGPPVSACNTMGLQANSKYHLYIHETSKAPGSHWSNCWV